MAFRQRKFAIRNQVFGKGSRRRVGMVPSRTIRVRGVKQKPGERAARGKSQLVNRASKRSK
jgi:hypothetical protein